MEFIVIHPKDPSIFENTMIKFLFITDDYTLSFIIEGYVKRDKLEQSLRHLIPQEDLAMIVNTVCEYYEDAQIGKTEFFEVTSMAEVKRVLPSENKDN